MCVLLYASLITKMLYELDVGAQVLYYFFLLYQYRDDDDLMVYIYTASLFSTDTKIAMLYAYIC